MQPSTDSPAWQRAAEPYRRWPSLYHYGRSKMRIDPAYAAVGEALAESSLPLHDLGCGAGFLAAYLRECGLDFPILGSDLSARKIGIAQAVLPRRYPEVRFRVLNAARPPAAPRGNVVALDLLHYFSNEEQAAALRAWSRLVAPGGRLLVRTTLREANWRYLATLIEEGWVRLSGWITGGPCNFPRRELLERVLAECGMAVEIRPLWGRTPFNSYWIEALPRVSR